MKQFKTYYMFFSVLLITAFIVMVEPGCVAQALTVDLKNQYINLYNELNMLSSKLHQPFKQNNNTYKILKPFDIQDGIRLYDKAIQVNGYEAINLTELDIFSQDTFLKILEEGPLHLVVATVQDNQGVLSRQYFRLDDIIEYIRNVEFQVPFRVELGEGDFMEGREEVAMQIRDEERRILSPLDRQPIINLEYFVIKDLNAEPIRENINIPN